LLLTLLDMSTPRKVTSTRPTSKKLFPVKPIHKNYGNVRIKNRLIKPNTDFVIEFDDEVVIFKYGSEDQ